MDLQHVNVKVFAAEPAAVDLADYSAIFNAWIQAQDMEELLVDVADYRHVHHGPGMVLIGHEANYSLDESGGRLGLLYNRKARVGGGPAAALRQAIGSALRAARRLENEHGLRFKADELHIVVNDRLLAPNTAATLTALQPALEAVLAALYAGAALSIERDPEPRERFNLHVSARASLNINDLLQNLSARAAT
jgi:hypothetical protein